MKCLITIGLEIHVQILAKQKIFAKSPITYKNPPNSQLVPFDIAFPGTLPILNYSVLSKAQTLANLLNCRVNPVIMFDRKHYHYPDLPMGYQITQKVTPFAVDGYFDYLSHLTHQKPIPKRVKIHEIHLENDTGKMISDKNTSENSEKYIDYNRQGVGLVEIVTEPSFESSTDCLCFVKNLVSALSSYEISEAKMERGSIRVDSNVQIDYFTGQGNHDTNTPSTTTTYIRSEIKNLNSPKNIADAIDYEINRLIRNFNNASMYDVDDNHLEKQLNPDFPREESHTETYAYDSIARKTVPLRVKRSQEYRYTPEYNIPPIMVSEILLENPQILTADSPNLMHENPYVIIYRTLQSATSLPHELVTTLTEDKGLLYLFNYVNSLAHFHEYDGEWPKLGHQNHRMYVNPHNSFSLLSTAVKAYLNKQHKGLNFLSEKYDAASLHKKVNTGGLSKFVHLLCTYVLILLESVESGIISLPTTKILFTIIAESYLQNPYPESIHIIGPYCYHQYLVNRLIDSQGLGIIRDPAVIQNIFEKEYDRIPKNTIKTSSANERVEKMIRNLNKKYKGTLDPRYINRLISKIG